MSRSESTVGSSSSNVMYTPSTPRMRERQQFNLTIRPEENESEGLLDLVGQTWNVHAASALFGFQQDDIHLKLYSKKLREEIANTLSREDVTYDAKFFIEDNISRSSHPAIKIEVIATDREKNIEKSIYKGILLSWRIHTETNIQDSIKLPLLLCRGTSSCMDAVHSIISIMFDCQIVALTANEDDLSWLVPIIIMASDKEEEPILFGEVQMEYILPELPVTDTITVKFHISDLRKILSVIMKNQDDRVNIFLDREHVETFYEILHKQMLTLGGLQLGLCMLHRINMPGITVMGNRIKVMNIEIMNNILLYFSDKALDTFHTIHINI